MKHSLLLTSMLVGGLAFAQSFTSNNEYAIGETQVMYQCDSSAANLAEIKGSGATWDFSKISWMDSVERNFSINTNANTTDFPSSNKVLEIKDVLTTYLETSASERNVIGFEYAAGGTLGNIKVVLNDDKLNVMNYDFNMGDELSDVFSGTMTSNLSTSPASGTSYTTADGIGTLILTPTVTKTNVIRLHTIDSINTTISLGPVSQEFTVIFDQYDYYDFVTNNLPLFTYLNITILQGAGQLSSLNFVLNSQEPTASLGLSEQVLNNVNLYPNPVQDELHISGLDLDGSESIEIRSLTGQLIRSVEASESIHVADVEKGLYLLLIEKDGKQVQHKFLKN
ncbi:MAG: T9SS type A sorting domain-containing protein [Bacteroidetes bacterium]|nr:MAG: T9SS type A sorting domain-containing protein [Bacteroidota bacterium]